VALTKLNVNTIRQIIRRSPYLRRLSNDTPDLLAVNEKFRQAHKTFCSSFTFNNQLLEEQHPGPSDKTTEPGQMDNKYTMMKLGPVTQENQNSQKKNHAKPWLATKVH